MKKSFIILSVLILSAPAFSQLSFRICEADGITKYDGRDLMVGEKLAIYVRSDTSDYGSCGIFVSGTSREIGKVAARETDPNTVDNEGSHYINAGNTARVIQWADSYMQGVDFYGSIDDSSPGDWFVTDYHATGEGTADIKIYDYSDDWDYPVSTISIDQVRTRDMNNDSKINMKDMAFISYYWQTTNCNDPNGCSKCDFDDDTDIDLDDYISFADYWLCTDSTANPIDETIRYRIVDENGNNMITMDYGDSIRLYLDLEYIDSNDLCIFDTEIQMDDPNDGDIDNRLYDPNDPDSYTAEILASPLIFKYWNGGKYQTEGIEFFGATLGQAVSPGYLGSFIYTCKSTGQQRLRALSISSSDVNGNMVYPASEDFIINHSDGGGYMESGMMSIASTTTSTQTVAPVSLQDTLDFIDDIYESDTSLQSEFTEQEWEDFRQSVIDSYNEELN